jgi:REP element-mobilizing transposase RayT
MSAFVAPPASSTPTPRRRCRPLRVERDDTLWFVTCRTIEERFWLHPLLTCGMHPPNRKARRALKHLEQHADKRLSRMVKVANQRKRPFAPALDLSTAKRIVRGLVGSALARAQERYGVEILAVVVMSNHVHLLVRTPRKNLARFMAFFKARVADSINRITGKRGPLWARRYDAQPVLEDRAVAGRIAYSLDNPVSSNLVSDFEHWPGLNVAAGVADSDELPFEHLDCSAWHRSKRPDDLAPFFRTVTLRLSKAPANASMPTELYRASVMSWVKQARAERDGHDRHDGPALGVDTVMHADFEARPKVPKFSRRPYCFGDPDARDNNFRQMTALHAEHERCSEAFLTGQRMVKFPAGTYPPPILVAA